MFIKALLLLTLIFAVSCDTDVELKCDNDSCDKQIALDKNKSTALQGPTNITPGEEWVKIESDAGSMGLDTFYIMKYEAKAWRDDNSNSSIDLGEVDTDGLSINTTTHRPISIAENQPWRRVSANDSATLCESLGDKYHLASNAEYMAIARDLEDVDLNWTGGTVGSGVISRGNSGEAFGGYISATNPDAGTIRNSRAKFTLSSGEEIYDIAGNVSEWADWDMITPGFQTGPTTCPSGWSATNVFSCAELTSSDYDTQAGNYSAGSIYGGSGGAATRGSHWINTSHVGIFAMIFHYSQTYVGNQFGFRCVYRP